MSSKVDVLQYVDELELGLLGVEAFCAAVQMTGETGEAERELRARPGENAQIAAALHRLFPCLV